jgi:hypothetical protein
MIDKTLKFFIMIRVGAELQDKFNLSGSDIESIYECLLKSGYDTMRKLKNGLKKKTLICKDGDVKFEMDADIVKVLITTYNKFLKNKPMKGGSNGLSIEECSNMTLKQIKKTDFYKNLPRSVNKSKLKKSDLCKLLEKIRVDERDISPTPLIKSKTPKKVERSSIPDKKVEELRSERVTANDKSTGLREKIISKFDVDIDNKNETIEFLKKNILEDIEYDDLMEYYGIKRGVDMLKEHIKTELQLIK